MTSPAPATTAAGLKAPVWTLLYGVAPLDPVSYGAAAAAALFAGLAGSYLPARRASRTDPAVVLRGE